MSARRALILLDHGSRVDGADRYLRGLAEQLGARRPELLVLLAHLEIAPPSLLEAVAHCAASGAREISVYPLFLAAGKHLERDVPGQLESARAAHPQLRIDLLQPLGARSELADLVLASYEQQESPEGETRSDEERRS